MTFTATYRDRTGAEYKKAAMAAGRLLHVVLYALLICAAGCNRMPAPASADDLRKACCVFATGSGRLIGGGVFVGVEDGKNKRLFCLTALHVAVMTDSEHPGSFYRQSGDMRLHVAGIYGTPCELTPNFDENRWSAVTPQYDIAYVELEQEEVDKWRSDGADIRFILGSEKKLVEIFNQEMHDGFVAGSVVLQDPEDGQTRLDKETNILAMLPERLNRNGITCVQGGVTNVPMHFASNFWRSIDVAFSNNTQHYCITTEQYVVEYSTVGGDSGSPVFVYNVCGGKMYPLLLGLVSVSDKENPISGVMPLYGALPMIRHSPTRPISDVLDSCKVYSTR